MFKAGVLGCRIDQVRDTQLSASVEACEFWGMENPHFLGTEFDVAMDTISDDFHPPNLPRPKYSFLVYLEVRQGVTVATMACGSWQAYCDIAPPCRSALRSGTRDLLDEGFSPATLRSMNQSAACHSVAPRPHAASLLFCRVPSFPQARQNHIALGVSIGNRL